MQANHKTIDEITTSLITIQRRDPRTDRSELVRIGPKFSKFCWSKKLEFFLVLVRSVRRFNFFAGPGPVRDFKFQLVLVRGRPETTYQYLEEDFAGYFLYCSSLRAAYLSKFLKNLYPPVAFFYNQTFDFGVYASSCENQASKWIS